MAKKFSFRGKSLEELQQMSIPEFAALCRSRQRRTLSRGLDAALMKRVDEAIAITKQGKEPKPVKTHRRSTVIIPKMVGLKFAVHRGNTFEVIEIMPQALGHYLGELVLTRKKLMHGKAGIGATRSSTAIAQRK
jgi:small subunit ribosomal protein S19